MRNATVLTAIDEETSNTSLRSILLVISVVLVVMVGEQAQEMQFAHWIPTTGLNWLAPYVPSWMGLWFSVFPTIQTLLAQAVAALLVLGSYIVANRRSGGRTGQLEDVVRAATFSESAGGP